MKKLGILLGVLAGTALAGPYIVGNSIVPHKGNTLADAGGPQCGAIRADADGGTLISNCYGWERVLVGNTLQNASYSGTLGQFAAVDYPKGTISSNVVITDTTRPFPLGACLEIQTTNGKPQGTGSGNFQLYLAHPGVKSYDGGQATFLQDIACNGGTNGHHYQFCPDGGAYVQVQLDVGDCTLSQAISATVSGHY